MAIKLLYPAIAFRFPSWAKINAQTSENNRYAIAGDGILWSKSVCKKPLPMSNHVEMAGLKSSLIFSYRVEEDYSVKRFVYGIYPNLRLYPNGTHSSLGYIYKAIKIDGGSAEKAEKIFFNGILTISSKIGALKIERSITSARNAMAQVEKIVVTNSGVGYVEFDFINQKPNGKVAKIFCHINESIPTRVSITIGDKTSCDKSIRAVLNSGESVVAYVAYSAGGVDVDAENEYLEREKFVADMSGKLSISTPDKAINQMLMFTKLRAAESIFDTKGGYMHAPGGGGFYAAMWTNDQCEYANPYFAYLGYDIACKSAVNSFEWFGKYVKQDEAIVSSIIAGGDGVWHGAGDRGDNAMYVYGLTHYIMTVGDKELANSYLDKLIIAIEYTISKINADGVVESDSDELENRLESGKANLSTSCIAYDALISMGYLLSDLDLADKAARYNGIAAKLKNSIENYFGASVEGYDTYRYCKEEHSLRSWICLPLTVGIFDRANGSIDAIMSDKLQKGNGILSRSGERTYWDRSALYALRGMFMAGRADRALDLLSSYSKERLLGEHAPYPVEAYPEGNGAHLSAESALYQRIFTEGILGYRPIGLHKYEIAPNLPSAWDSMSIKRMQLNGKAHDIEIVRASSCYKVTINGQEYSVLPNAKLELTVCH